MAKCRDREPDELATPTPLPSIVNENGRRERERQQQLAINELLAELRSSSTIPTEQSKSPLIRRRAGCCRWACEAEATGHVHGGVSESPRRASLSRAMLSLTFSTSGNKGEGETILISEVLTSCMQCMDVHLRN